MSSKTLSRAANCIEKMLDELAEDYDLYVDLEDVDFSKQCCSTANEYGLLTLEDIYQYNAEELKELYDYNSDKLLTLSRNVRKVYNNPEIYFAFGDDEEDEYDNEDYEYYESGDVDNLDDILSGWENVREYDEDYLENLADWDYTRGFSPKKGTIDFGDFVYECDSQLEENLINKLIEDDYFKMFRGQNFEIEYKTKRKGKAKIFKPDFVMLNQDNYIVIVEVKPLYNIPTKRNQAKYRYLSRYCERKGYLYCMCDDNYRTIDDLEEFEIDDDVKAFVAEYLDIYGKFDKDCFDFLKEEHSEYSEVELKCMLAAIVVQCNLSFKKGDLAGGINNLKIYRKTSSTI